MNCRLEKELVSELVEKYGSPLYIFHEKEFRENYMNLLNAIRAYYPKYNIAYSYKTNYTPRICEIVKEMGGLAEVVSDMEFNLARKFGYDYEQIIYNGPVKGLGLFEQLKNGGVANIDSLDEMATVVKFAKENPNINLRIAFRVNIDIGQGFISRFGLDAYEDDNLDSDSELKKAAEELFDDLGLTMSAAINMFLKSAVNYDGIPFEVKRYVPNETTKAALSEYEEMKNNKSKYLRYDSFDEIMSEVAEDVSDYNV